MVFSPGAIAAGAFDWVPAMRLLNSPKIYGRGVHRVVPAAETLRRLRSLAPVVGITRLADITGLDRVGIPTYTAVMPDTADILSVYNGKGATKTDAKVGALMEAVERYSALRLDQKLFNGTYLELSAVGNVLDPRSLILGLHSGYDENKELAWVKGFDLIGRRSVLVPAQAVSITFEERFGHPCYAFSTTNGLASGNTREEAICHALCELIERDAWTLTELLAHYLPEAGRQTETPGSRASGNSNEDGWEDDVELYPVVDLSAAALPIRRLLNKFHRAGLYPTVKDITSDLGVPVVFATVEEYVAPEFPPAHFGLGAHPDAEVAVMRALTEVAQCRAVDIQGVREDIAQAGNGSHPYAAHTKRTRVVQRNSWYFKNSAILRPLQDLPSHVNGDILDDINLMLDKLKRGGIRQAIAVDLTKAEVGIPVFRLLVPGLESWAADHGRLGWRAGNHWRKHGGQFM
jgi:ribosomal protein S12 methylthiotransferase accessory factor